MSWKLAVLTFFIFLLSLSIYMLTPAGDEFQTIGCTFNDDCVLSLCDCRCYVQGQTPEELKGILCGQNCLDWYNVSGCECIDFNCKEIMV